MGIAVTTAQACDRECRYAESMLSKETPSLSINPESSMTLTVGLEQRIRFSMSIMLEVLVQLAKRSPNKELL